MTKKPHNKPDNHQPTAVDPVDPVARQQAQLDAISIRVALDTVSQTEAAIDKVFRAQFLALKDNLQLRLIAATQRVEALNEGATKP